MQSYLDEVIRPRLRPLQLDEVAPDAITEYLDGLGQGIDARLPEVPDRERARLADVVTGLVVAAFAVVRVAPDAAAGNLATAGGLIEQARP